MSIGDHPSFSQRLLWLFWSGFLWDGHTTGQLSESFQGHNRLHHSCCSVFHRSKRGAYGQTEFFFGFLFMNVLWSTSTLIILEQEGDGICCRKCCHQSHSNYCSAMSCVSLCDDLRCVTMLWNLCIPHHYYHHLHHHFHYPLYQLWGVVAHW